MKSRFDFISGWLAGQSLRQRFLLAKKLMTMDRENNGLGGGPTFKRLEVKDDKKISLSTLSAETLLQKQLQRLGSDNIKAKRVALALFPCAFPRAKSEWSGRPALQRRDGSTMPVAWGMWHGCRGGSHCILSQSGQRNLHCYGRTLPFGFPMPDAHLVTSHFSAR